MNNPESVKLEVFTFKLKPLQSDGMNTFDSAFASITNKKNKLLENFFKFFVKQIDEKYSQTRDKAFSLTNVKTDHGFVDESIWGILKGGRKGSGKTASPLLDKIVEEDLAGKVINDKYFFYINMPSKSNTGYIFFQVYGSESIRSEFINVFLNIFKISKISLKPDCHPILPTSIKDEFKTNSKILEVSYNSSILASDITEDPNFKNMCNQYEFEITLKPKVPNTISSNQIGFMNKFLSSMNLNKNSLKKSVKTKVLLENNATKKSASFQLDVNDVMPRIYLHNRINIDSFGTPDFSELKVFCETLLTEISLSAYTKIERI